MVKGRVIAGIVISILIILGAYFFVSVGNVQQSGNSVKVVGTGSSVMQNEKTIEITDDGFSPSSLTVSAGDKIIFENKGAVKHWPISEMFDSGHGLAPEESYSLILYEKGTIEYHDNLNANLTGTIIAQ
jgi:plastocyanin